MSHNRLCPTKLGRVNQDLMKSAFDIVAKQKGGKVTDSITNYIGHDRQKVDIALEYPGMERGVGMRFDANGVPSFYGDPWGKEDEWNEITNQISKSYKTLGIMNAAKRRGFTIDQTRTMGRTIEILTSR